MTMGPKQFWRSKSHKTTIINNFVVIVGVVITQAIFNGLIKAYGLIYLEFLSLLERGPGETSWVAFAFATSVTVTGPLIGCIINRVSPRLLCLVASVLGSFAWVASSFASNVPTLVFTYGVLVGGSSCVFYVATVTFVNSYFEERLVLANGLMASGSSLGGILMPFVITLLVKHYSSRGCMIIVAGIWLNQCVTSMCFVYKNQHATKSQSKDIKDHKNGIYEKCTEVKVNKRASSYRRFFSLAFITLCCFFFLTYGATQGTSLYLPAYAEEKGLNALERSTLVAISSGCDLLSRVLLGLIGDITWIDKSTLVTCIVLVVGIYSIVLPIYTSTITLYLYGVVFGFCGDVQIIFLGIFLREVLGKEHIGTGTGIVGALYGIGGMAASALIGYLAEVKGTFSIALTLTGSFWTLGALIFYVIGRRFRNISVYQKYFCN